MLEHLKNSPLSTLLLTLVAFQAGLWIYQRCGRPALLHPVATGSALVAGVLWFYDIDYSDYVAANELLTFFLGPCVVALAVPLYREFKCMRQMAVPILLTTTLGALMAAVCGVGVAWLLGASKEVLLAVAPKAATTPIAIGIAETIGAMPTLTTGIVVFTGVVGTLLSPLVFWLTRLRDPRQRALILGVNAHGVGVARSFDISPSGGAFATLAMGLTGIFTALTLPYLVAWLGV